MAEVLATAHAPNVCQYCRRVFDSNKEKGIHATLEHAGEQPLKFSACSFCGARRYLSLGPCDCQKAS